MTAKTYTKGFYHRWWLESAKNPVTGKRFTRRELRELARDFVIGMPEETNRGRVM